MHFQHILAEDITHDEAVLLDRARQEGYDGVTAKQLGHLILERVVDVWRLEEGPTLMMCTSFTEDFNGRVLEVNMAAGRLDGTYDWKQVARAVWQLASRLACHQVIFISSRPGVAKLIGGVEVARLYNVPKPEGL